VERNNDNMNPQKKFHQKDREIDTHLF
jgi:hypothetical protein